MIYSRRFIIIIIVIKSAGRGIRTLVTPRDHKLAGFFAIPGLRPTRLGDPGLMW